jgi:hypothetical protein
MQEQQTLEEEVVEQEEIQGELQEPAVRES